MPNPVYLAEWDAFDTLPPMTWRPNVEVSLDRAAELSDQVWSHLRVTGCRIVHQPKICRSYSAYYPRSETIRLHHRARAWVAIHEAVHRACWVDGVYTPHHGPQFAARLVDAIGVVYGSWWKDRFVRSLAFHGMDL